MKGNANYVQKQINAMSFTMFYVVNSLNQNESVS